MDGNPRTLESYYPWAVEHLESTFLDPAVANMYRANMASIKTTVEKHEFFQKLNDKSGQWCEEYTQKTDSQLFTSDSVPTFVTKPFESAIDKSFRFNVLWNENFPEQPKDGWITTTNLVVSFNDVIRGCLVCKYVDGPKYVTEKLSEFASSLALKHRFYSQERDDGYYAYHFYVKIPVNLLNIDFTSYEAEVEVEIQVTTQLQEVLRSITHKFYEKERSVDTEDVDKWKWNFESGKFKVGYLSHTLHLLESIILESRNSVLGKEKDGE